MRRPTLIESNFDLETHTSYVVLGTDIGQFEATVRTEPADYAYESKFFGCQLAEMKATYKWARAHYQQARQKQKGLQDFWRSMTNTRNYDSKAYWVKVARGQIDRLDQEACFWQSKAEAIKRAYHTAIITRDSLNNTKNRCEEYNND